MNQAYDNTIQTSKVKNGGKGQRSMENTGQRTHNMFYNQQHSLQVPYQLIGLEGLDPSTLVNYQHSFGQEPLAALGDARRQSGNYSMIDNQALNKQQLDTFFSILPGGVAKNQLGDQALAKQMTNAEFQQFH